MSCFLGRSLGAKMQVVRSLCRYRSKEVVEVLKGLLEAAEKGDIRGLVYVAKVAPGDNRAGMAGVYRTEPAKALQATFALERMLRQDVA